MARLRQSQHGVEVAYVDPNAAARVSEHGVEVVYVDPNASAHVTQHGIEVVFDYTAASPTTVTGAGVSQHGVEVVYIPDSTRAVVSQSGVEVAYIDPAARAEVSQHGVEVVFQDISASALARVSQHGVEVVVDYTAASPTTVTGAGVSQHGVEVVYQEQLDAATGDTTANADPATGTGSAGSPRVSLAPNAGAASGTGSAFNPTVSTANQTNASAGAATGTGTSYGPSVSLAPNGGNAGGTGAAGGSTSSVKPTAGSASGSGSAFDATVSSAAATNATPGVASGTGAASNPSISIAPHGGLASGTGIARQPKATVKPVVGRAAGTGTAYNPRISTVQVASGTGTAFNASCTVNSAPGVLIMYDETTNITADVDLASAKFVAMANGNPGSCYVKVRDPNRDKSFTIGKTITLWIDGDRVWAGFIGSVQRAYAFPAEDTSQDLTRYLVLEGPDLNILFTKRTVFKQSNPVQVESRTYTSLTNDSTAIADLVANWLDLSGDHIDTTSLVETVGTVNIDQRWNGWQAGMTWGQAMRVIAAVPVGIFYIDAYRRLVYTDVDTPTAPYNFSDLPSGGHVGYRRFELTFDGTSLANDVLAWGVSGADDTAVFKRLTDSSSVAEHGRWQYAQTYSGVYKQATINKIADSIVNGSPQSKRGRKDDRRSITLETFTPGFRVAQKVEVVSNAFGYTETLPIRRLEVTFVNNGQARYGITLSFDIDQSFEGLIDPFRFTIPGISVDPPGPLPGIQIIGNPPTFGCATPTFADTFTRADDNEWGGPSDVGSKFWTSTPDAYGSVDLVSNRARLFSPSGIDEDSDIGDATVSGVGILSPGRIAWTMRIAQQNTTRTDVTPFFSMSLGNLSMSVEFGGIVNSTTGQAIELVRTAAGPLPTDSTHLNYIFTTGVDYRIQIDRVDGFARLKVWQLSQDEPQLYLTQVTDPGGSFGSDLIFQLNNGSGDTPSSAYEIFIDDVLIATDCDFQCVSFDDFRRTESGQWGFPSSTPTYEWIEQTGNPTVAVASGFGYGHVSNFGLSGTEFGYNQLFQTDNGSPDDDDFSELPFTMVSSCKYSAMPSGSSTSMSLAWAVQDNFTDASHEVSINLDPNDVSTFSVNYLDSALNHQFATTDITPPSPGTVIYVKWNVDSTGSRGKSWWSGSEPTDWMIEALGSSPLFINTWKRLTCSVNTGSGAGGSVPEWESNVYFGAIDFCLSDAPLAEASGGTCQEFTANGSQTVFTVNGPYVPGWTIVSVNGLTQRMRIDFEETDPQNGTITFTSAPAANALVRICYWRSTEGGQVTGGGGRPPLLL